MTSQELVAAACPKIRDLGWAYYFTPETAAKAQELGLDAFRFYFLGRGGVLGDVEGSVVASAFGYFNPTLVDQMWTSAREVMAPRDAGRAYLACAAELGRSRFSGIDGLKEFCAAADAVNDAADPTGLTLYAAAKAEPMVDDPAGRAMQLLSVLREFRGSAHLLAIRASGLDAKTAQFITRPGDGAMFGWTDADTPDITDDHRARRDAAEKLTDELVGPAYAVLDSREGDALLAGINAIEAVLAS